MPTERKFEELNFGGNGSTDIYGAPGDSRTGGHHMMSIAEAMARGLAPDVVITIASAHSTPTSGNEYKVVNWLRAAAIMAQVDPVARGYLYYDREQKLRLPPVRQLGTVDLPSLAPGQPYVLVELRAAQYLGFRFHPHRPGRQRCRGAPQPDRARLQIQPVGPRLQHGLSECRLQSFNRRTPADPLRHRRS